jgi:hypothetical protein
MTRERKTKLRDIETEDIYIQEPKSVLWINQTTNKSRFISSNEIGKRFLVVEGAVPVDCKRNHLGVTQDGLPFYEGDYPWVVNGDFKVYKWSSYTNGITAAYPRIFKIFANEIEARKYAIEKGNKKHANVNICEIECLSILDVTKIFTSLPANGPWSKGKMEQLISLVKQKQAAK